MTIPCSQPGEAFYGQDAQYDGNQFSFQANNNGTVTDLNTGLMWQQFLFEDKYSYEDALAAADSFSLGGYTDWRLPSIKEIYSLIDFRGITGLVPHSQHHISIQIILNSDMVMKLLSDL